MTTPEDIRKMYREEREATPEEFEATAREVENDPEAAVNLFQIIRAMAQEDRDFAVLHQNVIMNLAGMLVFREMNRDQEFATNAGKVMLALMEASRPVKRTPRHGKRAKSA